MTTPSALFFFMLVLGRLVMRIMSADFDPLPSHYSDDLSDVIKKMLALNPEHRPSVTELLELPIIREAREGLPAAGIRNSVDLASQHVGDGTPLSLGGVSPTPASEQIAAEGVQLLVCNDRGLSIDASMHLPPSSSARESVSPITPIGSEGGSSSLTSPQLPESAVKSSVPVHMPTSSDLLHIQQQHTSENYVDDFEPEPDDAWEAQLPRSRTASSEIEHIQEEEGALQTDSAAQPDFIEDECSDGSYEDDFDVEQDVAIPAVKLNGSICTIPLFEASSGSGGLWGGSADSRSAPL
jgi:serine/threonine protein kinase